MKSATPDNSFLRWGFTPTVRKCGGKGGTMGPCPEGSKLGIAVHTTIGDYLRQNQTGEKYVNRLKVRNNLDDEQINEVRGIFATHNKKLEDAAVEHAKQKAANGIAEAAVRSHLREQFGAADTSDRSAAAYWQTPAGVKIRVADHAPVYGRSTANVNIVTQGDAHQSWFTPDTIVIDIRGKSPESAVADVKVAVDRWHQEIADRRLQGLALFEATEKWKKEQRKE